MKLHVMSDLHLDFQGDGGKKFLDSLDPKGAEILVVAGDLAEIRFLEETRRYFAALCAKYEKVIYAPGNHDYYMSSPSATNGILDAVAKEFGDKLLILEHGKVHEIGGRRILGGTMWFPFDPMNPVFAGLLNDFNLIKNFVPWVYDMNSSFNTFIKSRLMENDIVITHHMPSSACVAARFKGDALNRFFVNDLTSLILDRKPALWIHGHTHSALDFTFGSTRLLCNPLGYPKEFNPFNDSLFVEI
jgi:predicted phosphodiesterase